MKTSKVLLISLLAFIFLGVAANFIDWRVNGKLQNKNFLFFYKKENCKEFNVINIKKVRVLLRIDKIPCINIYSTYKGERKNLSQISYKGDTLMISENKQLGFCIVEIVAQKFPQEIIMANNGYIQIDTGKISEMKINLRNSTVYFPKYPLKYTGNSPFLVYEIPYKDSLTQKRKQDIQNSNNIGKLTMNLECSNIEVNRTIDEVDAKIRYCSSAYLYKTVNKANFNIFYKSNVQVNNVFQINCDCDTSSVFRIFPTTKTSLFVSSAIRK